ncbi:MAG: cytochrome C oxidase subunit IV family protein [Myxococcaceae bacterium]
MAEISSTDHRTHSHAPSELEHHGAGPYYLVWAALLVLTGLTVWTGQMHLPTFGLLLALIIATTKATLVLLFFMHLWEQKGVNRVTFSITISFVILLLLGIFGDVTTRWSGSLPHKEPPASELPSSRGTGH